MYGCIPIQLCTVLCSFHVHAVGVRKKLCSGDSSWSIATLTQALREAARQRANFQEWHEGRGITVMVHPLMLPALLLHHLCGPLCCFLERQELSHVMLRDSPAFNQAGRLSACRGASEKEHHSHCCSSCFLSLRCLTRHHTHTLYSQYPFRAIKSPHQAKGCLPC